MNQFFGENTTTKDDLINYWAETVGVNKREARNIVYSFFDLVKNKLIEGHPVRITGLGLFKLIDKSSRPGMNISSKEKVEVLPRRVVTFKAGVKLKHIIEINQCSREVAPFLQKLEA